MTLTFGTACTSCHTRGVNRDGKPCLRCDGKGIEPAAHAPTRRDAPDTSREAAKSLSPSRITGDRKLVLELLREHGPLIDEKLVVLTHGHMSDPGARTRRSELVRDGLVEDSGRKEETVSGHPAIVWRAV